MTSRPLERTEELNLHEILPAEAEAFGDVAPHAAGDGFGPGIGEGEAVPPGREDAALDALRRAGLLAELDAAERKRLHAVSSGPRDDDEEARIVDLLLAYYGAAGDAEASARRVAADRFFALDGREAPPASVLVARLARLAPEVGEVKLGRIGEGAHGQLVLRSGDSFAPVIDDYEETLETGEIDLREMEERPTVTVRGIVHALNVLLSRMGVATRLVPLRGDVHREVYVGVRSLVAAMDLMESGLLEDDDPDDLMELCAW
jgi:hypothetical protein